MCGKTIITNSASARLESFFSDDLIQNTNRPDFSSVHAFIKISLADSEDWFDDSGIQAPAYRPPFLDKRGCPA